MKKRVSVFLVLALILLSLTPASAGTSTGLSTAMPHSVEVAATYVPSFSIVPSIPPYLLVTDISGDFTDANFKQAVWTWLGNTGTPGIITQAAIDARLLATTLLNVEDKEIASLAGLEHFSGLTMLGCDSNNLTSLPALPPGLTWLDCSGNDLTALPTLPVTLEWLFCAENDLTELPALPASLEYLYCYYNPLGELPELPENLQSLACTGNLLADLPPLPDTLHELYCNENQLTRLPELPASLRYLDVQRNLLTDIDIDVSGLDSFNCAYNYLQPFYGSLAAKLSVIPVLTKTPQYGVFYNGGAITLNIGQAHDPETTDFKLRFTADNALWGDVTNLAPDAMVFSTSNNGMAKVDTAGVITGMGEGSCTITARYKGIDAPFTTATIPVTVTAPTATATPTATPTAAPTATPTVAPTATPTAAPSATPGPGTGTGSGSDVDYLSASSWAVPELEEAEALGLFTDKVKDNLTQDITREEFCGIVVKLYEGLSGETANPILVNPFSDTNDVDILKAYELGIVNGLGAGRFAPDNRITRQEICVMIYRALKAALPGENYSTAGVSAFADEAQIASWAIEMVRFASKNGIMKGTGAGRINPLANTSREQGLILVKRTHELFTEY